MATRMQQRRGTAQQWTDANPVLAAGEIGFETDTNQFKIGDGVNLWAALSYFKNLEDLGGSLDDYILVTARAAANGVAPLDADGEIPLGFLAKLVDGADSSINTLRELGDVVELNTDHRNSSTNIHGIADTAQLATKAYADSAITTHVEDTTSVHGIANTANIAMLSDVSNHSDDTTLIHGISNTANLAYLSNISDHNTDTTDVHGITDTAALATKTYANSAVSTAVSGLTKSSVGLGNVDNTTDAAKPVSTATQTALDLKAPKADPTFTGTVSGVTKSHVGLGNVDNTTDAAKPVSTATQTALDAKAPLASPALTGTPTAPTAAAATNTTQVATTAFVRAEVAALVNSAGSTLDTLGEIATALGNDANLSTTLTNAIALKAPLASPTFTGTVTAPAITATALITASASGVAFTDGTQTKEGVPSRTPIIQKTAAYTLSALTERDSLIEVSSATGVTVTIPANSAVAYPVGTSIDILQTSTGQVTIAGAAGVTVNATPGLKLRTTWSSATLFKRATDTWVVYGDLTA